MNKTTTTTIIITSRYVLELEVRTQAPLWESMDNEMGRLKYAARDMSAVINELIAERHGEVEVRLTHEGTQTRIRPAEDPDRAGG